MMGAMSKPMIPVACSLDASEASGQIAEWRELAARSLSAERIDGGYAVTFAASDAPAVEELARKEAACCGFLSIETTRGRDFIRLVMSSENPDAMPVIESLVGSQAD